MKHYYLKKLPLAVLAVFLLCISACSKKVDSVSTQITVAVSTFAGNLTAGNTNATGVAASFNRPSNIVMDAQGNLYVADMGNNLIRKITSAGVVTTFAGSGEKGSTNGTGTGASFNGPQGLAIDGSGNLYVAESLGGLIRKITTDGTVTTFAGGGTKGADGTGTAAGFSAPTGIAIDGSGNLYVADAYTIRKITSAGVVTTFAGSGASGSTNGTGTAASFSLLIDIAIGSNNIYVTDSGNNMIRRITSDGVVTTLAGNGTKGSTDGTGNTATFDTPVAITTDNQGYIYVSDFAHHIRGIDAFGTVTTIAGSGSAGNLNGSSTDATFSTPYGIVAGVGSLYVADTFNNQIRKLTAQ